MPMLPYQYAALEERFATVRPWAKTAIGDVANRCAICMGYTLKLTPSQDDATIQALTAKHPAVRASFLAAPRLPGAPAIGAVPGSGLPARAPSQQFFIRAAELLPRVQRSFGKPDIQGVSKDIYRSVLGKKGVIYLENCYQTPGDIDKSFLFFQMTTGDHWDLFNGIGMVAEGLMLAGNSHTGQLYFWQAR
jgi:hypothetical protein